MVWIIIIIIILYFSTFKYLFGTLSFLGFPLATSNISWLWHSTFQPYYAVFAFVISLIKCTFADKPVTAQQFSLRIQYLHLIFYSSNLFKVLYLSHQSQKVRYRTHYFFDFLCDFPLFYVFLLTAVRADQEHVVTMMSTNLILVR